ncbi:MAG: LptA/OstA family protein [Chakrabartia sp.]
MRNAPLLIGLALIAAVPALGQALKGHNAKSPVDVEADRIEVQDRADRAVFSGNVTARQDNLTLSAGRLTVAYARQGGGVDIERLDASGGVSVRSPSETARGDFAVYDLNKRIITVIGDVELTQGSNRVRGGRLVIDLDTGRAIMDGRGVAGASGSRVTGRFTVADRPK